MDDTEVEMPNDVIAHILLFCSQPTKVGMSKCNRELRRLVWFSGLWNDEITVYDTNNFSHTLVKYRQTFAKIQKISFGPDCSGLRPAMLSTITHMVPRLKSIHMDQVKDKLFLFGFHIKRFSGTDDNYKRFFGMDDNYVDNTKDIRKLLERLKELRVALSNYSLGLYMLIDRYKYCCPTLRIQTVVGAGLVHDTTPLEQHSIMPFMVGS